MLDDQEWRDLCEQASREQDPDRLQQLIERINDILEERERRLREGNTSKPPLDAANLLPSRRLNNRV